MSHANLRRLTMRGLLPAVLLGISLIATSGCSNKQASFLDPIAPTSSAKPLQGRVIGGQQPVAGATIQLYAAGTPTAGGAYGQGAVPLITGPLPTTDANGNFTITGTYTVPALPSHFYVVASGGSPGVGTPVNPNLLLMAAVGQCTATTGLSPSLYININEVTTVAAVFALSAFMAPPAGTNVNAPAIGAPSSDLVSLQNGFETVNNLVNTSTGVVVLPTSNWAASTENGLRINSLADILASCVNSNPAVDTNCMTLFNNATPAGPSFVAADTNQGGLYMALNPTNNVSGLFNLIPPSPPFIGLTEAPADFTLPTPTSAVACQSDVPLGTAANFAILAASTVTNTGSSGITGGSLGLSPGTSVTGFPPGFVIAPAMLQVTNPIAAQAKADLASAYSAAVGLTGAALLPADLSGLTLSPSLYKTSTTALVNNSLTLDAQGDPNAVFIFQVGTALTVSAGAQLILINGAQTSHVFWQMGTLASLGANSSFGGTMMAGTAVTLASGASLHGRALAETGAVTLSSNIVTAP